MKRFIVSLAALVMTAGLAQADDSDPAAVTLMAQCKAAMGGAALDKPAAFHETGTILRDGHAGTYEMYADLHAIRTAGIHTIDGKIGGGGFDGTNAWRYGPDGKVTISTDPKEIAEGRFSAYLTLSGFFYPDRFPATFKSLGRETAGGKSYDVVAVTLDGTLTADLWLDIRTHRLARLGFEGMNAVADVLDYRQVDGTWIGFKNRQVEDTHTMVQTLATLDYVPLDPDRFVPPSFGN